MALVWAAAHHPPKEVRASAFIICPFREVPELQIMVIPVVISRDGRRRVVTAADLTGSSPANEMRIENRMIYPPIRVIVSNPFMIQSSRETLSVSRLKPKLCPGSGI